MWCGVELTAAKGNNDGSVNDVRYFTCNDDYGVFVQPSRVSKLREPKKK
jgi:dynactin complex subunit